MAAVAADRDGADRGVEQVAWAAEWSTWYTQYLRRAAEQSERTLELYQRVIDCVARGELAPTAHQDRLNAFYKTRGATYGVKLSDVTLRFFSGVVQSSTAYSREMADVLTPDVAPPFPMPTLDPSDPARWFQQLAEYGRELSENAASAYQSFLDRVSAGEVAPREVQLAAAGFFERRVPEFLHDLGSRYFELLNGLNDIRSGGEQEFLADLLATAGRDGREPALVLNLVGPLGTSCTATISLANTRDERAIIRCSVTDVRRIDGVGPAFIPRIDITPDHLELAPGEEAVLSVVVRLDEGDYDPNVQYVGALFITGHGEPRLEVPLRITATQTVQAATSEDERAN